MEPRIFGVSGSSTFAGPGSHSSSDSARQDDGFICGVECDPSSGLEYPTDWYRTPWPASFFNSSVEGYQHNQVPQSGPGSIDTFDQLTSTSQNSQMPQSSLVPVDSHFTSTSQSSQTPQSIFVPINLFAQFTSTGQYDFDVSNRSLPFSNEDTNIFVGGDVMEHSARQPPSLFIQDQNDLWTGQVFDYGQDTIISNINQNFPGDDGHTADANIAYFEPDTPSQSSDLALAPQNGNQDSSTAVITLTARCASCKALKKPCEGLPRCDRCRSKGIPKELCLIESVLDVLTMDKWLRDEYKAKRVYPPTIYKHESTTIVLKHYTNGPELPVECYCFKPGWNDPAQTTFYWKSEGRWREIKTPAVSLTSLKHSLEPYIEASVPIVLEKAVYGPNDTNILFWLAWKFCDNPTIWLLLKMHTALELLKIGWFVSGKETLKAPVLYDEKSPLNGQRVAHATVQRQLDHKFEELLAKWEPVVCMGWEKIMKKTEKKGWVESFVIGFLILHIQEQDAQRLKIHCEQQDGINKWKHPLSPTTLAKKAIMFCNTFLAHFRAMSGVMHPLRHNWTSKHTERMTNGLAKDDKERMTEAVKIIRNLHIYFKQRKLLNRKLCDTYIPGDDDSGHFTWSSLVFLEANPLNTPFIELNDFLGGR